MSQFGACRNYYAEVWVRHADWKEAEFFEELPAHLRGEVAAFLMDEVFEQSDFFRCPRLGFIRDCASPACTDALNGLTCSLIPCMPLALTLGSFSI